jgi:hypothetical protein
MQHNLFHEGDTEGACEFLGLHSSAVKIPILLGYGATTLGTTAQHPEEWRPLLRMSFTNFVHFPRFGALGNKQSRKPVPMQVCLGDGSTG